MAYYISLPFQDNTVHTPRESISWASFTRSSCFLCLYYWFRENHLVNIECSPKWEGGNVRQVDRERYNITGIIKPCICAAIYSLHYPIWTSLYLWELWGQRLSGRFYRLEGKAGGFKWPPSRVQRVTELGLEPPRANLMFPLLHKTASWLTTTQPFRDIQGAPAVCLH